MNLNCQTILKMTEAQLRYKSDVSLQEAGKPITSLRSISLAAWCTAIFITWGFWTN